MANLNKTMLIGRLGKTPVQNHYGEGLKNVTASLCTAVKWKDKDTGEWKEKPQWHNIVIKNTFAFDKALVLQKGDLVYCEGDLEYRKYTDKQGVEKTITEIVVYPYRGIFNQLVKNDISTASEPSINDDDIAF